MLAVVRTAAGAAPVETLLPLGPAQVTELFGTAWTLAPGPRHPLQPGDRVSDGQQVQTGPEAHLELRFADGTLLRVGDGAALTLLPQLRRVALHRGRVLVAADRMLGGLGVLTRQVALLPEGTTFLAEVAAAGGALTVLEGAVCACAVVPAAARPTAPPGAAAPVAPPRVATLPPTQQQMVLPGEQLELSPDRTREVGPGRRPQPRRLLELLKGEPLIVGFTRPLPALRQITELAEQQRRGVLAGRNERLRREIFWKRKPRAPLQLPPLFSEPDSVIIRYTYPD
jgi:hypothetical protein